MDMNRLRGQPIVPVRANTYNPVAKGGCSFCGNVGDLRFVYGGPNENDFLACEGCGKEITERQNEDAQVPGGVL